MENRTHPIFQLCALFINREDEDINVYDEQIMNDKIEDWKKEGYAATNFFRLAFNLVPNFIPTFQEVSGDTSKKAESEKKSISKEQKTK